MRDVHVQLNECGVGVQHGYNRIRTNPTKAVGVDVQVGEGSFELKCLGKCLGAPHKKRKGSVATGHLC